VANKLDEECEKYKITRRIVPHTPLERLLGLLWAPIDHCVSQDWLLPEMELVRLFEEGAGVWKDIENERRALRTKRFDAVVPLSGILIKILPHRFVPLTEQNVLVAIAHRCNLLSKVAKPLADLGAQLVAAKAIKVSEIIIFQFGEFPGQTRGAMISESRNHDLVLSRA